MAEKRRRRRWPIALAVVAALLAIGALLAHRYSRPERLTAMLIDTARSQLGAELAVGATGGFALYPKLHLVLPKPSLRNAENGAPFLSADSADVVVPWSTLWGNRIEIERVELVRPRLDVDELQKWIVSRPPSQATPDIRFALRARDAVVVSGGKTVAEGVALDLKSAGDVNGWLAQWKSAGAKPSLLPPLDGTIEAKTIDVGGTRVEGLRIESRDDSAPEPRR